MEEQAKFCVVESAISPIQRTHNILWDLLSPSTPYDTVPKLCVFPQIDQFPITMNRWMYFRKNDKLKSDKFAPIPQAYLFRGPLRFTHSPVQGVKIFPNTISKLLELLPCSWGFGYFQNIIFHSFSQWTALTNCDNISYSHISKTRRQMHGHIFMSLFKTIVFLNVMKIISTNNDSPLHLHFNNNTSKDTISDGNITSEWTLFVNVSTLFSLYKKISGPSDCDTNQSLTKTQSFDCKLTSLGALNPNPTSRMYLKVFCLFFCLPIPGFRLRNMIGCFWKALSVYGKTTRC